MPSEKRPLSEEDAWDVEATCRAVKRLQVSVACDHTLVVSNEPESRSNTDFTLADQIECTAACTQSISPEKALTEATPEVFCTAEGTVDMQHDAVLPADQPALRTALTPSRSPPQRSLSSPDMSRFKFRLTLTKPPVHPTSSGKIRRQLSLTDSIDDDGALLKSTSDRHCEQERLFHQLDQKLNLDMSDSGTVPHATSSKRTPFPLSPAAMQQGRTSSKLESSAATQASTSTHQRLAVKLDQPSPLNVAVHDQMPETLHESSSDDVCQPGTPIRREDSIPVRAEEHQLIGEAVFAALYEQTNVLLRNLHFERISRRASTS